MRNLADSFKVIFTFFFFFFAACFSWSTHAGSVSTFLCMCENNPSITVPQPIMAPIKYFKDTPHGSTPKGGRRDYIEPKNLLRWHINQHYLPTGRLARIFDTHFTYCPLKISATFAPIPNKGSFSIKHKS